MAERDIELKVGENGEVSPNEDAAYKLMLAPKTFVNVGGAVSKNEDGKNKQRGLIASILGTGEAYVCDDTLVFKAPEKDISRYEVVIEKTSYCYDLHSYSDGTYVMLQDKQKNGHIVSAFKLSDENAGLDLYSAIQIQTADGIVHTISNSTQRVNLFKHHVPSRIRYIEEAIRPINRISVSKDKLTVRAG